MSAEGPADFEGRIQVGALKKPQRWGSPVFMKPPNEEESRPIDLGALSGGNQNPTRLGSAKQCRAKEPEQGCRPRLYN